jgi:hypothetical protein
MMISRLNCNDCGVIIEGQFYQGRLAGLNAEQLHFAETFIRCEGTIKRVEKELGISYPTVRSRLKEVIQAMGFAVLSDVDASSPGLDESVRLEILDQLNRGEITYDEAMAMLKSAEG